MVELKTYAQRLTWAMDDRKVSIQQLAKELGFTPNGIKKARRGGPTGLSEMHASTHTKTAKLLNVNPNWLATGDGDRDVPAWSFSPAALEMARAIEALRDETLKAQVVSWLVDKIQDADELHRRFQTSVEPKPSPDAHPEMQPAERPADTSVTTSGGKGRAGPAAPRKRSARSSRAG